MSENRDKLLDHDFDGIKELDNNLPTWWLWLFYISIIWGVVYMLYFHVLDIGYSSETEYRLEMDPYYVPESNADGKLFGMVPTYRAPYSGFGVEMTPWMASRGKAAEAFVELSHESDTVTYVLIEDAAGLTSGRELFVKNCVQCHGQVGEGGIGPNLTDDYWLHDASASGLVKSIKYGYPAKGMIAWRGFLKEDQILQVAGYINSLRGSNPANGKPPQGELVEQ